MNKEERIVQEERIEIIHLLNKAYADEWLAFHQYHTGSKVAQGPLRPSIVEEFAEHAQEEKEHADMIADRILELGGVPLLHPKEWFSHANCGYAEPSIFHVASILEQNIKGEMCAIAVYLKLLEKVERSDPATYYMVLKILRDEEKHQRELKDLLIDVQLTIEKQHV